MGPWLQVGTKGALVSQPTSREMIALRTYAEGLVASSRRVRRRRPHIRPTVPMRRRFLATAVSVGALLFGNVGIAVAASPALPGDSLYPLDLAYERIAAAFGFDLGGADERFDEAEALLARGDVVLAVETLARGLAAFSDSPAAADAATQLAAAVMDDEPASVEFLLAVSQLLEDSREFAAASGDDRPSGDTLRAIAAVVVATTRADVPAAPPAVVPAADNAADGRAVALEHRSERADTALAEAGVDAPPVSTPVANGRPNDEPPANRDNAGKPEDTPRRPGSGDEVEDEAPAATDPEEPEIDDDEPEDDSDGGNGAGKGRSKDASRAEAGRR